MAIVVACGLIPAFWTLMLLEGVRRPAFEIVYLGLNVLLPLGAGTLVATLWRRPTVGGILVLAASSVAVEATIELFVLYTTSLTIHGMYLTVAIDDYAAWAAMFCLFAASGLYRLQRIRHSRNEAMADPGDIRARDLLQFASKLLGFAGAVLAAYAASKQHPIPR